MSKSVILFACIETNIGDDLFVRTICNRYPNVDFYITNLAKYGDLEKIPNLHFDQRIAKWSRLSTIGEQNRFKSFIASILIRLYETTMKKYNVGVCIVGNAFKNTAYYGKSQSRWMKERVRLVDKFYLLSTNFGPYYDKRWYEDCCPIFNGMKDVCFRDRSSFELFHHLPNVRYAPDAILSLGRMKRNEQSKHILVSVIDCLFPVREKRLNLATETYEQLMAQTIDIYANKGYRVTILNANALQDRPASDRIYSRCNRKECITIFDYNGDIEEIIDLYANTSLVIATRLHTIILSWLFDIPVFPIVYDIKVKNLLKSYHFSGHYMEIDKLDNILGKEIERILEEYSFRIPDSLIDQANKQFEMLDNELLDDFNRGL